MQKKLKSSGNGWEFYFTKPILKLLGYNPKETNLLITSKNKTLYIEPIEENDLERYKDNMVRKLQKSGCSYGLYLPAPLIEILDVNPENDAIDVEICENKLFIKKYEC